MYSLSEMKKMLPKNKSGYVSYCLNQDVFLQENATVECIPNVLSIPSAFYHGSVGSTQDVHKKNYTPSTIFKERIVMPIKTSVNNGKMHFFAPYEGSDSFKDGFFSLVGHAPMLAFSFFSEFLLSLSCVIKAVMALLDSKPIAAKIHIFNAASHFLLIPAMAVVAAINVPIEIIRFFTRSIATLINICNPCTGEENKGKMGVCPRI